MPMIYAKESIIIYCTQLQFWHRPKLKVYLNLLFDKNKKVKLCIRKPFSMFFCYIALPYLSAMKYIKYIHLCCTKKNTFFFYRVYDLTLYCPNFKPHLL